MRGRGATVNGVAPNPPATPLLVDGKPQEVIDSLTGMPPLERSAEPEVIAEGVTFPAGPARWVNGQFIYLNGGVAP
jgi:3-oxoacyl-[acyl-carrier protein] reductase